MPTRRCRRRYRDGMPDESKPNLRSAVRPLTATINVWWRACIIALGLAGLGSGGVAVFVTQLEAGPVALLAVGFVLLLVGVGGRLPSRLKMGENEAAWEGVEEFVRFVGEDTPTEQTPELLEALDDLAEVAPTAAAAGLGGVSARVTYERLVTDMLIQAVDEINNDPVLDEDVYRSVGPSPPLKVTLELVGPAQMRFDAAIRDAIGNLLVVEVKYLNAKVPAALVRQVREYVRLAADLAKRYDGRPMEVKALLISNQELSEPALAASEAIDSVDGKGRFFRNVRVTGMEDFLKVDELIRSAFGISPRS
jgi:hypothetical protein